MQATSQEAATTPKDRTAPTVRVRRLQRGFSLNTGAPYYRLHASREAFDRVAKHAVEGVGIAAVGRVTGKAWNTIARWTEKARAAAARFNERTLRGYELVELQADELRAAGPDDPSGDGPLGPAVADVRAVAREARGALKRVRCHYHFFRPHMALRFGPETRTPAMQAGLASRRLSFRDIFMAATRP